MFSDDTRNKKFTKAGYTHERGNAIMITNTITVVLFSTVVFGLMTKPLVRLMTSPPLKDPSSPKSFIVPLLDHEQDSEADLSSHIIRPPTSISMFLVSSSHTVYHYWQKFVNAFMRPMFGGRGFVPFIPGSPTEQSVHLPRSPEHSVHQTH